MKYRIVSRNKDPWYGGYIDYPYYYAQMKVFGMWIDCRYHPFKEAYNSYDDMLVVVQAWVNNQLLEKQEQPFTFKEEVVKTYD